LKRAKNMNIEKLKDVALDAYNVLMLSTQVILFVGTVSRIVAL